MKNIVDLVELLNLNDRSFSSLINSVQCNSKKTILVENLDKLYTIFDDEKVFMIIKNENAKVKYDDYQYKKLDSLFNDNMCHIFSKDNLKYITSFPRFRYTNEEAKNYLRKNQDVWDEFTVMQNFEGPYVQLFYYDKWYICTSNSLNANDVYGSSTKCIRDYFLDTGKCSLIDMNKLNKNYCYHFVVLHNKLKHIVQYTNLGNDYKELALVNITQYGSTENVKISSINLDDFQFIKPLVYYFSCFDELEATLDKIAYDNAVYKRISTEGFIIKHKTNEESILLKLQTEIYCQIDKLKPLKQNSYQNFLELYQHDKLNEILPYISKYSNEIIHRINMSMRTLSREILNIYHTTRKKKNCDIYDTLPDSYKKLLYGIHGLYIKGRRKDFINGKEIEDKETRSITVHDIYYYLKNLPSDQLKQIYLDRNELMKNVVIIPHLNLNCIYTLTQSRLMSC